MKTNKIKLSFTTLIVTGILFEPLTGVALAQQTQTNTAPPVAPSFLKQAGQALFEGTQKKVLQGINEKLQQQNNSQTTIDPATGQAVTTTVTPTDSSTRQMAPCRAWVNPGERPIAVLLCIHGLGLQSNSYEFFGKEASRRGVAVYAIDVRGFGSWMQAKGKTKVNFDECLEDIRQTLESIRAANPGLPVYVLGESMGGAIALRAASLYPDLVDGLISSVPAGERFNQGKTSAKVFLNLLSGVNLANVGGDILSQATKNPKLQAQWKNDPLGRLNLTPQELIQFQDFMNSNHEAAKKVVDMPVLFVQGNGDQLVKPEGTWELFNSVAAKDKSFFAVPGEHLIFEEAQTQDPGPRDQNFRVIQSWLSTKVGRRKRIGRPGMAMGGGLRSGGLMAGAYGGVANGGMRPGGPIGGFGGRFINTQGLETQAQMIENGQYQNAIADLENMRLQRPNDPNVLGLLGRAYYKNGQPDRAGLYFRSAMRMSRGGGEQARAFNSYLLDMSREAQAAPPPNQQGQKVTSLASVLPFAGFGGGLLSRLAGGTTGGATATTPQTAPPIAQSGNAYAPAKGKVYAFYANWADQCKDLGDTLNRLSSLFGDKVDIQRINIDESTSDALVDQFKIGPIPTVVFVSPGGQVSSTIIGDCTYKNYEEAVLKLR